MEKMLIGNELEIEIKKMIRAYDEIGINLMMIGYVDSMADETPIFKCYLSENIIAEKITTYRIDWVLGGHPQITYNLVSGKYLYTTLDDLKGEVRRKRREQLHGKEKIKQAGLDGRKVPIDYTEEEIEKKAMALLVKLTGERIAKRIELFTGSKIFVLGRNREILVRMMEWDNLTVEQQIELQLQIEENICPKRKEIKAWIKKAEETEEKRVLVANELVICNGHEKGCEYDRARIYINTKKGPFTEGDSVYTKEIKEVEVEREHYQKDY